MSRGREAARQFIPPSIERDPLLHYTPNAAPYTTRRVRAPLSGGAARAAAGVSKHTLAAVVRAVLRRKSCVRARVAQRSSSPVPVAAGDARGPLGAAAPARSTRNVSNARSAHSNGTPR